MNMNDMVIVSVDDHICEPGNLFDNQLSGSDLASAPKLLTDKNGKNFWSYECDYPHSDAAWPEVPERLWPTVQHLTDAQIDKVTHLNAMRLFRFDMFKYQARDALTVGALRAQAQAKGVDTSPKSSGGARPDDGTQRPVTSGDIVGMFQKQAAERSAA